MKRTPSVDVDKTFSVDASITKTWQDAATGERYIRGVASGVEEDRDGERVSKRAIAKMAQQPTTGGSIKLTSSHQQDWATEIGDVTKLQHDAATDELIYEAKLPPEGEDPLADKAWRKLTKEGRQLGVSIGGKLRSAYFEMVEKGGKGPRRRKVLDDVLLRHIALTDTPSYTRTFAQAVAKTFEPEQRFADADFFDEADDQEALDAAELVGKAVKPPVDDEATDEPTDAPSTPAEADEPTQDEPPAGTADDAAPSDAEEAQDLPMARHLACPNCGHEFAAELEANTPPDDQTDTPTEDDADARKSQETHMDPQETLAKIRALADGEADVAKTEETPVAEAVVVEVEKTEAADEDELSDVMKMLAASHAHGETRIDSLTAATQAGFETIAKAVQGLQEMVAGLPQGRKSTARVLPPTGEVEKTATDTDTDVEKAETALDALKALNAARGIR